MHRTLLQLTAALGLIAQAPTASAAQVIAALAPPAPMGRLYASSLPERLFCSRTRMQDEFAIQRRGPGWYYPAAGWDENLSRHYRIESSRNRSATLTLDAVQRPRMLQLRIPRPDSLGGGTDAVTIRFLPTGDVQEGYRVIVPSRRGRDLVPRAMREQPLRDEDFQRAHAMAIELAVRCIYGLTDPLPEDWLSTLLRRPL
ncbi:MAG: hypothetical protein KF709_13190 [Gemmatimonadaceae bacterium]|nr:hypothetical protein [Gemmatimonadaceae bacterium]